MAIDDNVYEIELDIERAEKMIAKNDKLNRLRANPDFKEIFIDGYLREEAARLVGLRADSEMQSEEQQKFVNDAITGIGVFNQYLLNIHRFAQMAENSLRNAQKTREDILSEAQEESHAGAH